MAISAGTDTEESAKIDDRRPRLTGFIDEQVDDAAHRLVGEAADLLAEDAAKVRREKTAASSRLWSAPSRSSQ